MAKRQFARVEEGVVVEGPLPLPRVWKNYSGFDNLRKSSLVKLGWYPVNVICTGCNPEDLVYTFVEETEEVLGTLPTNLLPKVKEELQQEYKEDLDKKLNSSPIELMTCHGIRYKFTTGFYDLAAWMMAVILGGAHVTASKCCNKNDDLELIYITKEDALLLAQKYEARRASQIFGYIAKLDRLKDSAVKDNLDDVKGKSRYVVEICESIEVEDNPNTRQILSQKLIETLSPRDSIRLPITHEKAVKELLRGEDQAVSNLSKTSPSYTPPKEIGF